MGYIYVPAGQLIVPDRIGQGGALEDGPRFAIYTALPGSTFSTSSATYVDVLDGTAGPPVAVTFVKTSGSGIPLLVAVGASPIGIAGVTQAATLGINDGSTDSDVFENKLGGIATSGRTCCGEKIFPGLAAGSYTFTMRAKMADSSWDVGALSGMFLSVMELGL